ncbi:Protein of unknown function [Amycolatopsis xylanica]|uniref:DUF3152 domain-containing protein n=1 Tax=Amycolatopsis xylanica TaxID=589385 RepID=A0A1H3SNM8_9PSEU|nr:DUF3152 domain-containing protein [Amycolatopsis xylanica]SDZ38739.1 Protein of unknown function [Amycolatopsis xylanica]
MDRVTQDARGDERRAQYPSAQRRAPHTGQYRPSQRASTSRVTEERYQPGSRRTSAQPLAAAWEPKSAPPKKKPADKGKLSKLGKVYGWRMYAVPILVVLTVLVVFRTASGPAEPVSEAAGQTSGAATGSGDGSGDGNGGDVLVENPPTPIDLKVDTAELPDGNPITESGKGTWHAIPLTGPPPEKKGTGGALFTYTIEAEDGLDPATYQGDDSFASSVQNTLSSSQSWVGTGKYTLQRVDANFPNPSFKVSLTSPNTSHRADLCGYQIKFEASCYRSSAGRVIINVARWIRGAKAWENDLSGYRAYAINHEVGHALGGKHVGCNENGGLAPVMMQQSFGVANDYVEKLNNIPGGDKGKVPADGKVCKPNAWPNPSGKPGG